jgi:hypothetical protein
MTRRRASLLALASGLAAVCALLVVPMTSASTVAAKCPQRILPDRPLSPGLAKRCFPGLLPTTTPSSSTTTTTTPKTTTSAPTTTPPPATTTTSPRTTSSQPAPPTTAGSGWTLNPSNTGLARLGLTCDQLPVYTGGSRPAAGTVISGKQIRTVLDLSAGNITIERSCVRPTSASRGMPLIGTTNYTQCNGGSCPPTPSTVTIRDSEIDGSLIDTMTVAGDCAFLGVGNLYRNYMHDMGSGICFYYTGRSLSARAEGNYVHRLRAWGDPATTGSHNEAFTIRDFDTSSNDARTLTVVNNRLDAKSGNDTGAAFIQTYAGNIDQVTMIGNLFEGNGYQLRLSAGYNHIYGRSMRAIDNRFSGTGYGPAQLDKNGLSYGWAEWRENYLNDASKPSHQGASVPAPT